MSEHILTIESRGEYFRVNEKGEITRAACGWQYSGKWRLIGASVLNNFGYQTRFYTFEEIARDPSAIRWHHANGKPRVHLVDLDHGTRRQWGAGARIFKASKPENIA